jgi:hypothetical protein
VHACAPNCLFDFEGRARRHLESMLAPGREASQRIDDACEQFAVANQTGKHQSSNIERGLLVQEFSCLLIAV